MPFLNARLISHLAAQTDGHDAVVPMVNGMPEPLHAIYHRRLLPVIEGCLKSGEQKVQRMFAHARVRYVPDEVIERFDPDKRSFKNVNTPQEYKEVVCSVSECRNCS